VDVLVVDYRLPCVDGLAVTAHGRRRHPHLHVVVVTSYPEVLARMQRPIAPVVVLTKPLVYADLVSELESFIASRSGTVIPAPTQ
jgi:CheY-like chemotaxis protein